MSGGFHWSVEGVTCTCGCETAVDGTAHVVAHQAPGGPLKLSFEWKWPCHCGKLFHAAVVSVKVTGPNQVAPVSAGPTEAPLGPLEPS